jgi:hypothetical protein
VDANVAFFVERHDSLSLASVMPAYTRVSASHLRISGF